MLIRLTYVACETIKEPGGPKGQRMMLRLRSGVLDKRRVVVLRMSSGFAAWRARDGAVTGTVWLAVYCQMERLPADIHT